MIRQLTPPPGTHDPPNRTQGGKSVVGHIITEIEHGTRAVTGDTCPKSAIRTPRNAAITRPLHHGRDMVGREHDDGFGDIGTFLSARTALAAGSAR
jgi:hypothetical protein